MQRLSSFWNSRPQPCSPIPQTVAVDWRWARPIRQLAAAGVILSGVMGISTLQPVSWAAGFADDSLAENVVETTYSADEYSSYVVMSARLADLKNSHPDLCRLTSIGQSLEGRDIWVMTIAAPGDVDPDDRPALLVTAGLDGNRLVGSTVAIDVVAQLLENADNDDTDEDSDAISVADFLSRHTLYVIPRANPDGVEQYFKDVQSEYVRNTRSDDADRDMRSDEDGPNDLNGDGLITMMRVFDLDDADMMSDPADDRLNVKPDRMKGERAAFKLYVEGIDDDGDGAINEDGPGGVDLNMNYMHGYPEHKDGAGMYQLSEPESMAVIRFALDHQNIAATLTYGRHDNLTNTPNGKGTYKAGTPKNIKPDDVSLYKAIGEQYRDITGLKKANTPDTGGSFTAWAYAQFGVPSFATPLWNGPTADGNSKNGDGAGEDAQQPSESDEAQEPLTPSGVGDISQETLDELFDAAAAAGFEVTDEMITQITPEAVEQYAAMSGIKIRRIKADEPEPADVVEEDDSGGKGDDGEKKKKEKPRDKEEARWLKYNDEDRNGEGFVAWETIDHPEFGEVEIGGWRPYFKTNPPAAESSAIAEKQVEFILDLAAKMPSVSLTTPDITALADGLYKIEASIVNDGFLPTGTSMAVTNRKARPYVVRLGVPNHTIVTGQRVHKTWKINGSGGRYQMQWIVRAASGSAHTITVYSEKFGEFTHEITLP